MRCTAPVPTSHDGAVRSPERPQTRGTDDARKSVGRTVHLSLLCMQKVSRLLCSLLDLNFGELTVTCRRKVKW